MFLQGDEFSCFTVQANLYQTWTERRPQSCCNKCSHLLPLRLLLPQQSKPLCSEHTPGPTRGVLGCKILSGVLFMMVVNVKSSEQKSSFIRFVCCYCVTQKKTDKAFSVSRAEVTLRVHRPNPLTPFLSPGWHLHSWLWETKLKAINSETQHSTENAISFLTQ